jgi:hypothetical protein
MTSSSPVRSLESQMRGLKLRRRVSIAARSPEVRYYSPETEGPFESYGPRPSGSRPFLVDDWPLGADDVLRPRKPAGLSSADIDALIDFYLDSTSMTANQAQKIADMLAEVSRSTINRKSIFRKKLMRQRILDIQDVLDDEAIPARRKPQAIANVILMGGQVD